MTYLEDLPNEMFLFIYQYLNSADILYAFTDLNIRIEETLFCYKQHIDLRYVTLKQHQFFIDNLNKFKDHIVSFIVDDEWTNGLTLWHALNVSQLQKLRIISYNRANLDEFLNQSTFSMLTNLHVGREALPLLIDEKQAKLSAFLKQICQVKQVHWTESFITFPLGLYIVDNFIQHLTISVGQLSDLMNILEYLPHLRYLKGLVREDDGPPETMDIHLPNLREFHLSVLSMGQRYYFTASMYIQYLPATLERFSYKGRIVLESQWLYGDIWAQSLPNGIQSFQLMLEAYYYDFLNIFIPAEEVKQSWSIPFWIQKNHCYMQCFDVKSPPTHYLLCTHDCSDFDTLDDSTIEAKYVFSLKPNDSIDSISKPIDRLNLNGLNEDAYAWINHQKQTLPTVERLSFQNGHIFLTTDVSPDFINLFQHMRSLTLSPSTNGDLIQHISSFSRLTSLTISDLSVATLILNCNRSFNLIKIFRIHIEDLNINQIEFDRLLHVFPHLYGFDIGFILHTQFERLMNEKLIKILPTSVKVSFRPKNLGTVDQENRNGDDKHDVENPKHEVEQKVIRNALAHDIIAWLQQHTFLDTSSNEYQWHAIYYAYESRYGNGHDCLTIWH